MDGSGWSKDIDRFILNIMGIGFALGATLVWIVGWGLPMLWQVLKPLIHGLTS